MEYCGEVVSDKVAQSRVQVYEEVGLKEKYIISLHGSEFIDATRKGSLARYINHSCDPNCVTRKWTVLGEVRIGIFAIKDISAETEVTYDYNFQWYGGSKIQCRCGAESCVGFLGAKSRGFQVALLPIHGDFFWFFLFIVGGLVILVGLCKDLKIQIPVSFPDSLNPVFSNNDKVYTYSIKARVIP
jgi:hypothetical protein